VPTQVDDPAVKLLPGEGDRNAGRGKERISNGRLSVGEEGEGAAGATIGWAVGREEYSEATEKGPGQDGGWVGGRKFRRILLNTLRKEEVLVM
jgi:hypothetical protein